MNFMGFVKSLISWPVLTPKDFIDYNGEATYSNMLSAIKQAHSEHCRTAERFCVKVEVSYPSPDKQGVLILVGKVLFKDVIYEYRVHCAEDKPLEAFSLIERTWEDEL